MNSPNLIHMVDAFGQKAGARSRRCTPLGPRRNHPGAILITGDRALLDGPPPDVPVLGSSSFAALLARVGARLEESGEGTA